MARLIEEVRCRPAVWDPSSDLYRDALLKDKAWREIAIALSKDKNAVRHQWKKLRDSHRQAMLRRKPVPGQPGSKIKKWRYEDEMKFVLSKPTTEHRTSDSNITLLYQNEEHGSNDGNLQESVTDVQDVVDGEMEDVVNVDETITTGKERHNRTARGVDPFFNLMEPKERNQSSRTRSVSDDTDLFFASAAMSVRKLPRRLQNKVKIDLLNSIVNAEEENELNQNAFTPMPLPHTSYVHIPSPSSMQSRHSPSPTTSRPASTQSEMYNV